MLGKSPTLRLFRKGRAPALHLFELGREVAKKRWFVG